jgi:hypothetical protein
VINIKDEEKHAWIGTFGSDYLKTIYAAGYASDRAYAEERLKVDYPEFKISDFNQDRSDSPPEHVYTASLGYEAGYCCTCWGEDAIAIDNYLGKYQIIKTIEQPKVQTLKIAESPSPDPEREEWILTCGSEPLQLAYAQGYNCEIGYAKDRLRYDYPEFKLAEFDRERVDTPSVAHLNACFPYQHCGAYVSAWAGKHYVTIDNYLGKHQIYQEIIPEVKNLSKPLVSRDIRHRSLTKLVLVVGWIAIPIIFMGWLSSELANQQPIRPIPNPALPELQE